MFLQIGNLGNNADHKLAVPAINQNAIGLELVGHERTAILNAIQSADGNLIGNHRLQHRRCPVTLVKTKRQPHDEAAFSSHYAT